LKQCTRLNVVSNRAFAFYGHLPRLTHVNRDVRAVLGQRTLDVPGLLTGKLDVITVGVQVTSHLALEVGNTIDVVAGQNLDVHLLEDGLSPLGLVVHLAQEGQDGLVGRGLVSMNGGLEVDANFVLLALGT
jgi:hypothetical protein